MCEKRATGERRRGGEEAGGEGWTEGKPRSERWLGALAPAVGCLGSITLHSLASPGSTGSVASVSHFSHLYNGDFNGAYFVGLL